MVGCCSKVYFHKEGSIGDNSFVIFIKVDSSTIDVTMNEVIPCITANHWINLDKIILDDGILTGSVGHCQWNIVRAVTGIGVDWILFGRVGTVSKVPGIGGYRSIRGVIELHR